MVVTQEEERTVISLLGMSTTLCVVDIIFPLLYSKCPFLPFSVARLLVGVAGRRNANISV